MLMPLQSAPKRTPVYTARHRRNAHAQPRSTPVRRLEQPALQQPLRREIPRRPIHNAPAPSAKQRAHQRRRVICLLVRTRRRARRSRARRRRGILLQRLKQRGQVELGEALYGNA